MENPSAAMRPLMTYYPRYTPNYYCLSQVVEFAVHRGEFFGVQKKVKAGCPSCHHY